MNLDEDLIQALDLERTSSMLTRRWLDAGGDESAVYDILERHVAEDERHGQTLWDLLVSRGVSPPETRGVETPADYPEALIGLKESLVDLYDRAIPEVSGRERKTLQRLRDEDDNQRALLNVYFPQEGD
ncbi:hypothetical protein D3C87_955960 [compost metagenome]